MLLSPNYPMDYPNDRDCTITVTATGGSKALHLYVHAFDTEEYFDFFHISSSAASWDYHGDGRVSPNALAVGGNYTCEYFPLFRTFPSHIL